jgi:hypothetical protein
MQVECLGTRIEIPELLIKKYIKDFDGLPGNDHEVVLQLRESINEIIQAVAIDPEILHEREYLSDFVKALAMRQALETHGILYDA